MSNVGRIVLPVLFALSIGVHGTTKIRGNEVISERTVEVAVVVTNEAVRHLGSGRELILNYLTSLFRDVKGRFRTLSSSNVSFRVTSVTLMNSTEEQPFINDCHGANGTMDRAKAVQRFSQWIFVRLKTLPRFDVGLCLFHDNPEVRGHTFFGSACRVTKSSFEGVGMVNLNMWNSPELATANVFRIIMSEPRAPLTCKEYPWKENPDKDVLINRFFSPCVDKNIRAFTMSDKATCLKNIDENISQPVLDQDFDDLMLQPNTLLNRCRFFLNESDAEVHPEDEGNCTFVRCRSKQIVGLERTFYPADNTICSTDKYCFRGTCIEPGSILQNVESGDCLQAKNRFRENDSAIITECPRSSIPTDRFILLNPWATSSNDKLIATYYMSVKGREVKKKCLRNGNGSSTVDFVSCDMVTAQSVWEVVDLFNQDFLLKHKVSGKCVKLANGNIVMDTCNIEDPSLHWKLHLIYPLHGMCGTDNICEANLKIEPAISTRSLTETQMISVDMNIKIINTGEAAIAPAVLVSWNTSIQLDSASSRCIFLSRVPNGLTSFKCKLGRLLSRNETADIASLQLSLSKSSLREQASNSSFIVQMSASTASQMSQGDAAEINPAQSGGKK